ncbi:zinc-ribbon and DUF3426 domain-containing protein [Burkholderia ubonensis]|uniref:zinc-ribbon and DUF3426 domain-containing protein n=1 Tax=Burkholderia ubonensis TaxID=101571 RepID=UPI0009B43913|nr:zinc-ribbon and DUF3426 domain-containing protein [Burkholderia ubonensis]
MLLATRCPHCETVFRLQQEQLVLHGGLVRCGHCRQIFDAAESLVHEHAPQPEAALADDADHERVAEEAPGADHAAAVEAARVEAPSTKTVAFEAPAVETPAVEVPPVKARADEATALESRAVEAPAADTPAVEVPPAKALADEAAALESRAAEAPAADTPAVDAPPAKALADEAAAIESRTVEAPSAETPAVETPAAKAPADEARAIESPAVESPAAASPVPETEAHHAADLPATPPPRLFVDNAPGEHPTHADFRPDHWDMWAPWLDGNVDPSLQHSGRNVRAEPLIPLVLPDANASLETAPGVVRLTATPEPSPGSAAAAAAQPAAPSASADLGPAHDARHDAREPRLAAEAPSATREHAPAADERSPLASAHDKHEPRFAADASADADRAATRTQREPQFATGAAPEPFSAIPAVDDDRPPFAVTRETRAPQRRGLLGGFFGGLVATVLAVLLALQLAWWQRETLMIYWPVTLGWFQRACVPLGCTVAPPRAIDGLRLDATDLRQVDGPRVLELKAPLTNRYRVALAYPSLELTLLDDTNHVTVRRVLAPRDYVRPGTPINAGLPAGATQTMIVRLDTNGAPASNFRVQIFYP